YRLREWSSTLFGAQFQLSSVNRMVWVGAATVLIVLILAPAVFLSMSEFDRRSRQLAALEKEQLARSEQLAAQEKELLARSEQLAAREKELLAKLPIQMVPLGAQMPEAAPPAATAPVQAAQTPTTEPRILCNILGLEPPPVLICFDADLEFWQKLMMEIY